MPLVSPVGVEMVMLDETVIACPQLQSETCPPVILAGTLCRLLRKNRSELPGVRSSSMSEDYAAMITALPLFEGYKIAGAERILRAGKINAVAKGEVLFKEGDPPDFVLLVLKGTLQVYVERQGRDIVLTNAGPSTILGELAVLCGIPRSASVRVAEDSTVLQWPASEFRGLLLKDVSLSNRIFRVSLRTLLDKEKSLIESLTIEEIKGSEQTA